MCKERGWLNSTCYRILQVCSVLEKTKREGITNNENVIYVTRARGRLQVRLMFTGYVCFNYYDKVK